MIKTKNIIKLFAFFLAAITVVAIGSLLIAANDKNGNAICAGVNVVVKGSELAFDIEKDAFIKSIETKVMNVSIPAIDLPAMEKRLEAHAWIEDAELYFDRKNILNISFKERTPIARVFTTAGNSYYVDEFGYQLPLLQKKNIPVHVVTGFTPAKVWNGTDSASFKEVKNIVQYIVSNPFWNAQVGQLDITPEGFDIIPLIGDHFIRVGSSDDIEKKLNKALLFYKKVLSTVGINKYAAIDVRFTGQVVGVRKETSTEVDELQLQKNIEELLRKKAMEASIDQQIETLAEVENIESVSIENTKPLKKNPVPVKTTDPIKANSNLKKVKVEAKQQGPAKVKMISDAKRPKAVMQKREERLKNVNN